MALDGSTPRRLVSLVPSTTETVHALSEGDRLVGVTRFCVHPPEARTKARVIGGTKTPRLDRILALEPDLVLANQEENRKEDVDHLREHVPVLVAYPRDVAQAVADIRALGVRLGVPEPADAIGSDIDRARRALRESARPFRYLYFVWRRPYLVASSDTFIAGFLAEAGGINVAPTDRGRYPEVEAQEIESSDADVLLLSSEPFPFGEADASELRSKLGSRFRECVVLVDGELLSWHGARLRHGVPYLARLKQRIAGLMTDDR
jgi:ABC-type Fe3+-hydroxamate transport system substrate-binding protein